MFNAPAMIRQGFLDFLSLSLSLYLYVSFIEYTYLDM